MIISLLLHPFRLSMGFEVKICLCLDLVTLFHYLCCCCCCWCCLCVCCASHTGQFRRHDSVEPIAFDLWQFHAYAHELYAVAPYYFAWMFSNRTGMAHVYLDDAVEYVHVDWFHSRTIGRSIGTSIFFLPSHNQSRKKVVSWIW